MMLIQTVSRRQAALLIEEGFLLLLKMLGAQSQTNKCCAGKKSVPRWKRWSSQTGVKGTRKSWANTCESSPLPPPPPPRTRLYLSRVFTPSLSPPFPSTPPLRTSSPASLGFRNRRGMNCDTRSDVGSASGVGGDPWHQIATDLHDGGQRRAVKGPDALASPRELIAKSH